MYSKNILTEYADTLAPEQGAALKKEIEVIQYEKGSNLCVPIEAKRAFVRAGIADLYGDLAFKVFGVTTSIK